MDILLRPPPFFTQAVWLLVLAIDASAVLQATTPPPVPGYDRDIDDGTLGYYPSWNFMTEGGIYAPRTNWRQWNRECDDGMYYFLTPRGYSLPDPGPMILDSRGDLVWSKHFANEWGGQAYDLMVQHYQGQEYLTFWTGDDQIRGHGSGSYTMLDSSYEIVHDVNAGNGLDADLHEFLLTPEGTALVTIYEKYPLDLSSWRTFDAITDPNDADPNWTWDCVLQELSVDTRDVLFEWRASDHFDINDTYHLMRQTGNHEDPFDWYHMNSIRKDELGNYLISARYTHSITYIDGKSGEIIWVLGGKRNMFMDLSNGSALNFAWQHDAQFVSPELFKGTYVPPREQEGYSTRLLTLFDNAAEDQNYVYGLNHSRGLLLEITFPTPGHGSASNVHDYTGSTRDISEIWELAAHSDHRRFSNLEQQEPDMQYPLHGHDKLEDPDADLLKLAQINGSSPAYTVRVIQSYVNPSGVRSSSQGSMQVLPPTSDGKDAKVLVSYGLNAVFTEFNANGTVLCDAHYGAMTSWERGDVQSYRVFKFPWVATPKYRPRMMIDGASEQVFVSWNGATQVATWVLQSSSQANSSDESDWKEIARKQKLGFETSFDLSSDTTTTERYLRVLALDSNDHLLEHGITDVHDRIPTPDAPAETLGGLSRPFGVKEQPTVILLGGFLVVLVLFTLFEIYRRYLCWKVGRPAMGAVRWRKSSGYRMLGDV